MVGRGLARRGARFSGSLLLVPTAALLALAEGAPGCGRGSRASSADPPGQPARERITVLLGAAGGLHFALAPLDPEAGRARRDGEALAKRFSLPGAGLARLHVLRFEGEAAEFDPKEVVVRAVSEEGEEVTLRPLVTFRAPQAPRDALVFRALAGPPERSPLPPGSWLPLVVVVPGVRDPERFRSAEVAGAMLESVPVDLEEWKGFLAAPKEEFFRRALHAATAPSRR